MLSFGRKASANREGATEDASVPPAVLVVQRTLSSQSLSALNDFAAAVSAVVDGQLWTKVRTVEGTPFESFPALALAPTPFGFGIASQQAARLLKAALLQAGHFREWVQLLQLIHRKPGRPKTGTNSDNSRFYQISRSPTAQDRLLLLLSHNNPDRFEAVCAGHLTPFQAAVAARLIPDRRRGPLVIGSSYDPIAAEKLTDKGKKKLLRRVFNDVGLQVQSSFIANVLEPWLGLGLAAKWKEQQRGLHNVPEATTSWIEYGSPEAEHSDAE